MSPEPDAPAPPGGVDRPTGGAGRPTGATAPTGVHAPTGVIAWFVENRVAANLLFFGISLAGYFTLGGIPQELAPDTGASAISIRAAFPGASAPTVEEGVLLRLEEAVAGLEGVEETVGIAGEGFGTLTLQVASRADLRAVGDEVRERVGALTALPAEAETPVVSEVSSDRMLLRLAVHGEADERSLREAARLVEEAVAAVPGVAAVTRESGRDYEISIETTEAALVRFGLGFDRLAAAIRRGAADIPGGRLRSGEREIRLRTAAAAATAADYERLPVITTPEGGVVTVGDLAVVTDGFADFDREARFDGEPAVFLGATLAPGARLLDTTDAVLDRVSGFPLPEGISVTPWFNAWRLFESRMEVLVRNGLQGLALIFLVLFFTLSSRLAVWTAAGLPVSFFGAFLLMPGLSVTVNMISLFAFILTLGIVVDDAIVVGENVQRGLERGGRAPAEAAVRGVRQVLLPVTFGVLTTMAAFTPLFGLPGVWGELIGTLPRIVIPVLAFSLLEGAWILPHHLARGGLGVRPSRLLARIRGRVGALLEAAVRVLYLPALRFALDNRAAALSIFVLWLALAAGLVRGGWVPVDAAPLFDRDTVVVQARLPPGSSAEATRRVMARLEAAVGRVREEVEAESGVRIHGSLAVLVGQQLPSGPGGAMGGDAARASASVGQLNWELSRAGERPEVSTRRIADRLRAAVRETAGSAEVTVSTSLLGSSADLSIRIGGEDGAGLVEATAEARSRLREYPGVVLVSDDLESGAPEFVARALPGGAGVGIGAAEFGRQVRQAFHGEEVQRIQRGRDEVPVVLRYAPAGREGLGRLASMRVSGGRGDGAPLGEVAALAREEGYSVIRRVDGRRAATVHVGVDPGIASASAILAEARRDLFPALEERFPDLRFEVVGFTGEANDTIAALGRQTLLAALLIYVLLAVPLSSWGQPFVILAAIPFGLAGAVFGHAILGVSLSATSFFGMAPLIGIVVNDALVLLHFMNGRIRRGDGVREAALRAGPRRFRAVLLTSLTTCAGLAPLLAERSVQAQFLIPMAASLAFGVAFATVVTLVLVPVLFTLAGDLRLPRPAEGTPRPPLLDRKA